MEEDYLKYSDTGEAGRIEAELEEAEHIKLIKVGSSWEHIKLIKLRSRRRLQK